MPLKGYTRKQLKSLSASLVQPELVLSADQLAISNLSVNEPTSLASQRSDGYFARQFVVGQAMRFRQTLEALYHEPELEHLTQFEIREQLERLCWTLMDQAEIFRSDSARLDLINSWESKACHRHVVYEVVVPIEPIQVHSDLKVGSVTIGPAPNRAMSTLERLNYVFHGSDFGETVAHTIVSAGSISVATSRGRERISRAVALLQVSLRVGTFLPDEHVWIRLLNKSLAYAEEGLEARLTQNPIYSSIGITIDEELREAITRQLGKLTSIGERPECRKLYTAIERAAGHFSRALSTDNWNDRIVLMFSSLESLLATKQDRRKGEIVTIRAMLAGEVTRKGFYDPENVLRLYESRSRNVHGSDPDLVDERQADFLTLVVGDVIKQICDLCELEPSITSTSKLHQFLESGEQLPQLIHWLAATGATRELIDSAKALLPERELPTTSDGVAPV